MASGDMYALLAMEASPNGEGGTAAISATTFYHPLTKWNLNATPLFDDRSDEFRGTADAVAPDLSGFDPPAGSAEGRLYARTIGLWFTAMFGYSAPISGGGTAAVDPDGGTAPVGTFMHKWVSNVIDPSVIRSLQCTARYGNNSALFLKTQGVTVSQLDLTPGDQGQASTFAATLGGLYQSRIADPGGTASYDATTTKPFYRGNFSVQTWLTGTTSPIGASLSFASPLEISPVFATSLWPTSWQRPNAAGQLVKLSGQIDGRTVDPEDYDAFVASTPFGYKVRWLSTQNAGTAAYKYTLWIQGAATYGQYGPEDLLHNLRTGAAIPFNAGTSGGTAAWTVTLVNDVASYSSVS